MKTEKEIKCRVKVINSQLKEFKDYEFDNKKLDKRLKEYIHELSYEKAVLQWVLKNEDLPF